MQTFATRSQQARSLALRFSLFLFVAILTLAPAHPAVADEEHAEAEGLVLVLDGEVIVTQWEGVVTGEIEVAHEESTNPIEVFFLDADSTLFQPDDPDFELRLVVADELIALATGIPGTWQFTVQGELEGMTDLQVVIWHDGHADFTSASIEVHVEEEHIEAEGLVLVLAGAETVRQWEGVLLGSLIVTPGESTGPFEVLFLDHDGDTFVPEDPDFEMRLLVADSTVATLEAVGDWTFLVHGHAAGATTFNVVIWHDGHADFTSMDVMIRSGAVTAAPGSSFTRASLRPAAPNPFVSNTSIRYALPARMAVSVVVYDARGRHVETLFDGVRDAGEYAEIFDARPRGAGVYFVRLSTPGQTETTKLIHAR